MEIQVKVVEVLAPQTINKKDGTQTTKGAFIGETFGQYSKKVKFDVMGDKYEQIMHPVVTGNSIQVSFDVESREWQGKWYTDLKVWRTVNLQGVQQAPQPQAAPAQDNRQIEDAPPF